MGKKKIELSDDIFPAPETIAKVSPFRQRPTTEAEAMDIILGRTKGDPQPSTSPSKTPQESPSLHKSPQESATAASKRPVAPKNYYVQAPNQTRSYNSDLAKGQILYEYLLDRTALDYRWRKRWRQIPKRTILADCRISENTYRAYRQYLEVRQLILCGQQPGKWEGVYWIVFFPGEEEAYQGIAEELQERKAFNTPKAEQILQEILARYFTQEPSTPPKPPQESLGFPKSPHHSPRAFRTPEDSRDLKSPHGMSPQESPNFGEGNLYIDLNNIDFEDDDEQRIANTHLKYCNNNHYSQEERHQYQQLKGAFLALNDEKWDVDKCITVMERIGKRTEAEKGINSFAFWIISVINELQKRPLDTPRKTSSKPSLKQLQAETETLMARQQHLYVGMRQEEYQAAWQRKFEQVAWSHGHDPAEFPQAIKTSASSD